MLSKKKLHDILIDIQMVALEAGKKIMEVYNSKIKFELKEDNSPLTIADQKANDIIVDFLKIKYPTYAILSEEMKDDSSRLNNDYCWIVDPLDGTKEFIKRNGEFTVNIALSYKGKSILGVIFAPERNELYYAALETGAFYRGSDQVIKRINVSQKTSNLTIMTSRSHKSEKMLELLEKNKNKINKEISIGSSFKGCLIAQGKAEMYYRFGYTMEWDTAAMQIVVEEAGGVFQQMDDSPMLYNRDNSLNEKGFYILNNMTNDIRTN